MLALKRLVIKKSVRNSTREVSLLALLVCLFFFFVKRYALIDDIATYTSPTPISRPKLSDPQLSSSSFSAQPRHLPGREKERERERAQHQAAVTQTTFARLKKLNLKNYAAPRGYTRSLSASETPSSPPKFSPPLLTLTSASPTSSSFVRPSRAPPNLSLNTTMSSPTLSNTTADTSTDSTPLSTPVQTPVEGDEEDGEEGWIVRGEEEERLRWSLGMENGHFATTLIPSPIPSSAATPSGSPIPVPVDRNAYTSYPKSGGVEMGTSPPFSDLKETVVGRGGGSVYWDWGTAAGVALSGGEGKKESANEPTNLTNGGGGTGLMPPQRRRGSQQKRASGSSSSSSGSDSNSKNSKLTSPSTSTPTPSPPSTATSVTPKEKAKPPILTLPTSTLTRPSVTSPSGVQSPNLNRGLGYNSPQPRRHGHRHFQSIPSFIGNPRSPSTPEDSDAIYQALVREWCFAKGPSSGETTPVLVKSPSPLGLACALSDGE